jgi:hypothetical protein
MPEINLLDAIEKLNLKVNIASAAEENPTDAKIRRYKDVVLFGVINCIVLSIFVICTCVVLNTSFDSNANRWAMTIDSDIISAFLALLVGKKLG